MKRDCPLHIQSGTKGHGFEVSLRDLLKLKELLSYLGLVKFQVVPYWSIKFTLSDDNAERAKRLWVTTLPSFLSQKRSGSNA